MLCPIQMLRRYTHSNDSHCLLSLHHTILQPCVTEHTHIHFAHLLPLKKRHKTNTRVLAMTRLTVRLRTQMQAAVRRNIYGIHCIRYIHLYLLWIMTMTKSSSRLVRLCFFFKKRFLERKNGWAGKTSKSIAAWPPSAFCMWSVNNLHTVREREPCNLAGRQAGCWRNRWGRNGCLG